MLIKCLENFKRKLKEIEDFIYNIFDYFIEIKE